MIEYNEGIHLKGTDLWFDSKKKAGLSFISNANISKFTPSEKIIATPETIKFLDKKIKKSVVLACPFYRPFALGNLQVELVPSGHMLGSSQIIVDKGDKTLIYTGDINLKKLPTVEPAYTKHCDVLVMKCTYGLPDYIFPTFDESIEPLIRFINETLSSDSTPVILVEPVGKAQDIIKVLGENGFKLSLHKSVYKATKIYEEVGIEFRDYELFRPTDIEEKIVIIPPDKIESNNIKNIKRKKVAIIIEWAVEEKSAIKSAFKANEAFTFSNHAGYNELLQYVEYVSPEKVYLIDKHAIEFAGSLQKKGYQAMALEKPTQLNLL
ncbi:MAG: MBL fold metallo-hydrolase [Candidatus Dadabacteria bacterium]|nr:MBL fold metallo-hydrolase [Candidatus Dadabacteria bacterium]